MSSSSTGITFSGPEVDLPEEPSPAQPRRFGAPDAGSSVPDGSSESGYPELPNPFPQGVRPDASLHAPRPRGTPAVSEYGARSAEEPSPADTSATASYDLATDQAAHTSQPPRQHRGAPVTATHGAVAGVSAPQRSPEPAAAPLVSGAQISEGNIADWPESDRQLLAHLVATGMGQSLAQDTDEFVAQVLQAPPEVRRLLLKQAVAMAELRQAANTSHAAAERPVAPSNPYRTTDESMPADSVQGQAQARPEAATTSTAAGDGTYNDSAAGEADEEEAYVSDRDRQELSAEDQSRIDRRAPLASRTHRKTRAEQVASRGAKGLARERNPDARDSAAGPADEIRDWGHAAVDRTQEEDPSGDDRQEPDNANSDPWLAQLDAAIEKLEAETAEPASTVEEASRHARLRLLYLAAGRDDDAMRPIEGVPVAHQDFWKRELFGLATLLDTEEIRDGGQRAGAAAVHFDQARIRLAEVGKLVVHRLAFCTSVSSFGVYDKFEQTVFEPGQQAILYAELENFTSRQTPRGYHVALRSSYEIVDEHGDRVYEHDFAVTEEHCQNPRRDFFVRYFIDLPPKLPEGRYTIVLSIEDTLGQKIGQGSIDFDLQMP